MAVNLLEMLQSSIGPSLVSAASTYLGESETTTRSALGAAMPALLASLAQQGSTAAGASQLYRTITAPEVDTGLLGNLGAWLGGRKAGSAPSLAETALGSLFPGQKATALAGAIGAISGMKSSSVTGLLGLAAPVLFAFLKNFLTQGKMDAGGLASLLSGQHQYLEKGLDDRVAGALGFGSVGAFVSSLSSGVMGQAAGAAGRVTGAARDAARGATEAAGTAYASAVRGAGRVSPPAPVFRKPWFWGAAVAAVALLGWWFFTSGPSVERTATSVAPGIAVSVKSVELPGGTRLDVPAGGFVDSLVAFLGGQDIAPGKSFTFDDLQFETGSAALSASSARQLDQLAAVLKAYPGVMVNVGGHTDNTGDAAANKQLSADRAIAVQQALVGMGIDAARVSAEGFGPEKPIASNDTEEGRARNRRVDLVVNRVG
jgi:outer membrane protein OmpA-like peptidoglycan-associated protein